MNIQNQIESTERELKIRNYSPKTIKSYIYEIKEYFAFSKKDFENLNEKIKVRSAKKNKSLPVVLSMIKIKEVYFWPKLWRKRPFRTCLPVGRLDDFKFFFGGKLF